MLKDRKLTVGNLIGAAPVRVILTWILTLAETAITALVPLFIGFAIDGLLDNDSSDLINLGGLLAALIVLAVGRRIYDTRVYGTLRAELSGELVERRKGEEISATNARVGMGRELVDFLEEEVPEVLTSVVQLLVSLIILYWFHPMLSVSALGASVLVVLIYLASHRRFYRLNGELNAQTELQVGVLQSGSSRKSRAHFLSLRRVEIRLSDTEAIIYGLIFFVLLAFILFNLRFAATEMEASVGSIFSIVSYSWEFVAATLVLPATLQSWTRLSEIMKRINQNPSSPQE